MMNWLTLAVADLTRRMFGERHRASKESPAWWRMTAIRRSASSGFRLRQGG